jgi:hypothetical protein
MVRAIHGQALIYMQLVGRLRTAESWLGRVGQYRFRHSRSTWRLGTPAYSHASRRLRHHGRRLGTHRHVQAFVTMAACGAP